jgi:transposase
MHTYPSELGDGTAEVTALVQQRLRAIGPEFASVLTLEAFFRNFSNRSPVAAYSGSRPPRGKSGGINRDQGISKAGNPRLRRMMQK